MNEKVSQLFIEVNDQEISPSLEPSMQSSQSNISRRVKHMSTEIPRTFSPTEFEGNHSLGLGPWVTAKHVMTQHRNMGEPHRNDVWIGRNDERTGERASSEWKGPMISAHGESHEAIDEESLWGGY